ncbi:unnamed protein product [Linum trigynum]|uniref:Uncharacterized protein n=1 Tax=Linum trigynum TaxID=586398 RepID=A0AAV2EX82_9ROSI
MSLPRHAYSRHHQFGLLFLPPPPLRLPYCPAGDHYCRGEAAAEPQVCRLWEGLLILQALGDHKASHRKSISGAKIEVAAQSTSSTTTTSTVAAATTSGSGTPSISSRHRLDH